MLNSKGIYKIFNAPFLFTLWEEKQRGQPENKEKTSKGNPVLKGVLHLHRSFFSLLTDFDFSVPGSMKLHNLISKLKKWIKILEAKTKQLPKFFLIEEKCRFLSNFSAQTAEVEIPGEFLMPKPTHYYIKIARLDVFGYRRTLL